VGVSHRFGYSFNYWGSLDKGSSVNYRSCSVNDWSRSMDNWSSGMNSGSSNLGSYKEVCVVEDGVGSNSWGSFYNRSSLNNCGCYRGYNSWSSMFNDCGSSGGKTVWKPVVVSVRESVVVSEWVGGVDNGSRVVIHKSAVGLTVSCYAAVVVGISFRFSLSFSFTLLPGNDCGGSGSEGSAWKTSDKGGSQRAAGFGDAVMGGETDDGSHWSRSGDYSGSNSVVDKGSHRSYSMVEQGSGVDSVGDNGGSLDNRFNDGSMGYGVHWGCYGGSDYGSGQRSWEVETGVEQELGICFTLVETMDGLIAVTREGAGVSGRIVRSVGIWVGVRGGIVEQRIGFRLSQTK